MPKAASRPLSRRSCRTLGTMNTWRSSLSEQFPEFGSAPAEWELVDASIELGSLLKRAAKSGDRDMGKRVLSFVLWLDEESDSNEMYIYQCQDILRTVVSSPQLRSYFASLLNTRSLAQLAGCVEYLESKAVLSEIQSAMRLGRHGA